MIESLLIGRSLHVCAGKCLIGKDLHTPVSHTVETNQPDMFEALLTAGADVSKPSGPHGYTPLVLAVSSGSVDWITRILRHHPNVDAVDTYVDTYGETALILATKAQKTELVQLILTAKPDLSIKDATDKTAMDWAENSPAIKQLLDAASR